MELNLSHKKKLALAGAAAAAVCIGLLVAFIPRDGGEEPARRREYPVKKENIIVGIDAPGSVTSEKHSQFIELPLQIKEYKVKVGDAVSTGDVLAELSIEDIDEKLKKATEKQREDEFALQKLQTEKENFQRELKKKIQDLRDVGETAYQEKAGALRSKKTSLEQSIAEKQATIDRLKNEAATEQTEKEGRAGKLAEQTRAIEQLTAEHASLEQQIRDFTADLATDHTAELAALTEKKVQNELAIADLTREKQTLETTNFDQLLADAAAQIAQLEAEIATLQAELTAANDALKLIDEQRQKEKNKEDESVNLMVEQAKAQHADYDNQITKAQSALADSKKARDELMVFKQNPAVKAEKDGVILKLGFGPNAVTDATTAVAEIGTEGKKILELQVDPVDIADVSIGQEVSFYVDAFADATFYGTVESKSYLQDEKGKFAVRVSFQQTEQKLLDGMGANATLVIKQKLDILTVSNKAIFLEDGKSFVFVADENGALQKKEITTGFSDGRLTEVLEGLAEGDTAVVEERYEDS